MNLPSDPYKSEKRRKIKNAAHSQGRPAAFLTKKERGSQHPWALPATGWTKGAGAHPLAASYSLTRTPFDFNPG